MGTSSWSVALKPYGLVKQNIVVPIQQIISRYDFILEMLLRSDDEHRADALNPVQSGKVVISFVKDIERIRLIWYLIHCLHIVKFRFRNVIIPYSAEILIYPYCYGQLHYTQDPLVSIPEIILAPNSNHMP